MVRPGVPRRRCDAARDPTDHLPRRAVVSPYPRGSVPLVAGVALVVALLATACVTDRRAAVSPTPSDAAGARTLPADRGAAILYVALGDSTVEGVGATSRSRNYVSRLHERLRAVYPGARVVNLGVGGATSADVRARQLDRAIALRPHLVTLAIGPNDITTQVPLAAYAQNLETILGRLRRETRAVVVVNLIPDLAVTPRFRGSQHQEAVGRQTIAFNEALERASRAHGAELVNLYAASRREVPLRPELISADGYHPSDAGYARWAELVWAGVAARMADR
ncbi:MAG: GDSL family lipase [Candidatus Rokuibacteriota bacterium]|nr:MAG: GDSL family lipase [Candidatus Rokubacteria bacterium]